MIAQFAGLLNLATISTGRHLAKTVPKVSPHPLERSLALHVRLVTIAATVCMVRVQQERLAIVLLMVASTVRKDTGENLSPSLFTPTFNY